MPYPRLCSQTMFWAALAFALAGTCATAQAQRPGELAPGPGGPGGPPPGLPPVPARPAARPPGRGGAPPRAAPPSPYKPVTVTLPSAYSDPSFEAFRKQLGEIASHKDRAGLAKIVANNFFWMGERGDKAN